MKWFLPVCFFLVITSSGARDYEVAVTSVSIWVKVVDSTGKPVTGLTQSDFQVFEDKKKVDITCLEESVFTATASRTESKMASESPRKFVLFLDLYNTTDQEYKRLKPGLQDFIQKLAGTNSEVMLAALLASGKLGIVSRFTPAMDKIHRMIDQARGNAGRDLKISRNNKELADLLTFIQQKRKERERDTKNEESGNEPVEAIDLHGDMIKITMTKAYQLAQSFYLEEKRLSEYSLSAMEAFVEDLESNRLDVNEQAAILFISGGFNANPGRHYFDMIDKLEEHQASDNDIVKFATAKPGSRKDPNMDMQRELRKNISKLNRANLTVYAINTRGTFASGTDTTSILQDFAKEDTAWLQDYQDSLIQIANETGGLSFHNSLNFPAGFQRILDDLSHQYILCFSPSEKKKKDEYHEIKVICKRPGVQLRHRLGYYR